MRITVYLGSRFGADPKYREKAAELGRWIGEHGHTLVYGGGSVGLMGVLADSVLESGGRVIGVIPRFFVDDEQQHTGLDELRLVETMSERKALMIELGEFFIAFPGGIGTLEEISEVMTRRKLGLGGEEYVLYNLDGFYDSLKSLLQKMVEEDFLKASALGEVRFSDSIGQIAACAEAAQNRDGPAYTGSLR